MTTDEGALDRAAEKVAGLAREVIELNANLDAVVARAKDVKDLGDDVDDLQDYRRKNRRNMVILVISVILDIALSIGLYAAVHHSDDASHEAKRAAALAIEATSQARVNTNNLHQQCLNNNAARADNRDLWARLFALFPPPDPSTPNGRRFAQLVQIPKDIYQARDCNKVAPLPSG